VTGDTIAPDHADTESASRLPAFKEILDISDVNAAVAVEVAGADRAHHREPR